MVTCKKEKIPEIIYCPVCGYETEGILIGGEYTCEVCGKKFLPGESFYSEDSKIDNDEK